MHVGELDSVEDLEIVVRSYVESIGGASDAQVSRIVPNVVQFYKDVRAAAASRDLRDGSNRAPHYSLRTLCRALIHARAVAPNWGPARAVYEGCCASFLTQLDKASFVMVGCPRPQPALSLD